MRDTNKKKDPNQGIVLKTPREISLMREAGKVVRRALNDMTAAAKPGVSTGELAEIAAAIFQEVDATPLFLNYPNSEKGKPAFPSVLCASVNEQVVHGIPSRKRVLREGDIIALDTGCRLNGWCADAAVTLAIGEIRPELKRLLDVTKRTLELAIESLPQCRTWSQVAGRMQAYVREQGMYWVEKFVGHGIGKDMHEPPQVPNFVNKDLIKHDFKLEPGLVLAIEPMVSLGTKDVVTLSDHWTVVTKDRRASAHFEHTVALTAEGPVLITQ